MNQAKQTLELRVLRMVRELTTARGDTWVDLELEELGSALQLSPRRLKTAIQHLCQCNFLKKSSRTSVALSSQGQAYLEKMDE